MAGSIARYIKPDRANSLLKLYTANQNPNADTEALRLNKLTQKAYVFNKEVWETGNFDPNNYSPASHNHDLDYLDINGVAVDSNKLGNVLPAGYSLSGHNHNLDYLGINDTAKDSDKLGNKLPSEYADAVHNHDGDYVDTTGDSMSGDLVIENTAKIDFNAELDTNRDLEKYTNTMKRSKAGDYLYDVFNERFQLFNKDKNPLLDDADFEIIKSASGIASIAIDGTNPLVPIGGVVAWMKHLFASPALGSSWVECNGQTISDSQSPLDGVTIPDLNGEERFLRGSTTSGVEQDDAFQGHWHDLYVPTYTQLNPGALSQSGSDAIGFNNPVVGLEVTDPRADGTNGTPRTANETRPKNISVVWIMRIK